MLKCGLRYNTVIHNLVWYHLKAELNHRKNVSVCVQVILDLLHFIVGVFHGGVCVYKACLNLLS